VRNLRAVDASTMPQSALLSNVAEGLHAMAQPLTILRGALGALALRGAIGAEGQRYLAMSTTQVERLCNLLCNLRALLDLEESSASRTTFDLLELVERAIEDSAAVQLEKGVRVVAPAKDSADLVFADAMRAEQAVHTALQTIVALSSPGDTVQCQTDTDGALVRLVLENAHQQGKGLSSADRLALSLIEASLASQGGACLFTEKPLCLSLMLPLAHTAQKNRYITSDCLKTAV